MHTNQQQTKPRKKYSKESANNMISYKKSAIEYLIIDRGIFFDAITNEMFGGKLSDRQVESVNAILDECVEQEVFDIRHVAYILAEAYHNSHRPLHPESERLTPVIENMSLANLRGKPYWPYFIRGFTQLKGRHKYIAEGDRMRLDLLYNPDLMLDIKIAANSLVYCLTHGVLTGRKLGDYIFGSHCNYNKCRRVIDGTKDRLLVSRYAMQFERLLRRSIIVNP